MLLTLVFGIGANVGVFSVVRATLLEPLPFNHPERLMMLWESTANTPQLAVAYPNFLDWQIQNSTFDSLAAEKRWDFNMTGLEKPERIIGSTVSADFFDVFGVGPVVGRTFTKEDGEGSGREVLVLSYGLWQRRFGGDKSVLGTSVELDGRNFTVIGVMPRTFEFGTDELWIPISIYANSLMDRAYRRDVWVFGRLKNGVEFNEAQAEINTIEMRLAQIYPDENSGVSVTMIRLNDQATLAIRSPVLILFAAVTFILVIGCLNISSLFIARTISRWRDVATRVALGASRMRLVRLFLTESVVLSLLGGALGTLSAYWGLHLLRAASMERVFRLNKAGMDWFVLLFALTVSLATAVVCAILPILYVRHMDLQRLLSGRTAGSTGVHSFRVMRKFLAIGAIALALVLTVGAVALVKSFLQVADTDPGFRSENVMTARVSLPATRYPTDEAVRGFYRKLLDQVRNQPGVQSAAIVGYLALSGFRAQGLFEIEGRAANKFPPHTDFVPISEGYLQTFGIPLLAGRSFSESDTNETNSAVIIDEIAAREYWGGENPLGKRLRITTPPEMSEHWRVIVGIARHVKHFALDDISGPQMYVPYTQVPWAAMTLLARVNPGSHLTPRDLQSALDAVDPNLPIFNVRTMEDVVSLSLSKRRVWTQMLALFALVALVLAALGVYSTTSYLVNERVPEIGIRMALGADAAAIIRLIMKESFVLALLGIGIGTFLALAFEQLLASLLLGMASLDVATILEVTSFLLLVSLAGCFGPALKAAAVRPMDCIRQQ
jgi:putative ABC transport system permease protein